MNDIINLCSNFISTLFAGVNLWTSTNVWAVKLLLQLLTSIWVSPCFRVQMLIEEGAVELVVAGNLPIGCNAVYLTLFQTSDRTAYDKNGCLKAHNAFSKYHNAQLKLALQNLQQKYPHARISYADYYGASKRFFHVPKHFGQYNLIKQSIN